MMNVNRIKFGRLIHFDERSRQYPIRALIRQDAKERSYTWKCDIMLNQRNTSACTGFSVAHEAAARPVCVRGITNKTALEVYRRAQQLDQWEGEDYEGSSVLGAMKAGTEKGWYKSYRWSFGIDDLTLALGYCGPAVLGIYWYAGMSQPDKNGIIKPTGNLLGGHAILCNGYSTKTKLYRLHNSWGSEWGINGECFISADDLRELLKDQGEACIPLSRSLG